MNTVDLLLKHRCAVIQAVKGNFFCDQELKLNTPPPCVSTRSGEDIFCPHIDYLFRMVASGSLPGCRNTLTKGNVPNQAIITVTAPCNETSIRISAMSGKTGVDLTNLEKVIDLDDEAYQMIRDKLPLARNYDK